MIDPVPSGARDVLPDEMRELRAISRRLLSVFDQAGYGEVYTPTVEYMSVFERAGPAAPPPAHRHFDEQGRMLALRSDMTLPIARLATTRYASADPPLRFCYLAHVYRAVRPHRGQSREFLQGGVELLGAPAPSGTAEVLQVLCAALDAVGLESYRIGLGDASLYPALLDQIGVPAERGQRLLGALAGRDFVALERLVAELDISGLDAELLLELPQRRGGVEVLEHATGAASTALAGMRSVRELVPARVAQRLIFDLGLSREVGYYTGAIFEVYDPALGMPLGGGGRYDELLARFGRALPAVGFALNLERLHMALMGEERGAGTAAVGRATTGEAAAGRPSATNASGSGGTAPATAAPRSTAPAADRRENRS